MLTYGIVAERQKALLSQLSNIDYESKHKKLRAVRHGNTGVWLKKEPGYVKWLESDATSLLSCYGIRKFGGPFLISISRLI